MATKDLTSHRTISVNGLEKLTASRNELREKINNFNLGNQPDILILSQLDTWEQKTIQKVHQTADEVRKEVLLLVKSKQEEIKNQFETLSKELDNLRETKDTLEQDLTRLERGIAQINEDLKQSFQLPTVKLITNQSEQIPWNRMIYVEQKSQNTTSQQIHQSKSQGTEEFAPLGTFPEQYCEGRHCAKCGKCRDWYFTGDAATWAWIRNYKNWTDSDINRWRNNHVLEHFKVRDGETCIFEHGFGLPGLPPGPHLDPQVFGAHVCLCEDNIKSDF